MMPALAGRVMERVTGFPPGGRRRAVVAANLVAIGLCFLPTWHHIGFGGYRIDLDVYRIGARVWLDGGDLYGVLPLTQIGAELPFTYPPIATVFLAPTAWVSYDVANAGLTALTIAAIALVLRVFAGRCGLVSAAAARATTTALPVAIALEPVRSTIGYGQINALLMALITLDCLVDRPRWPRGALVGLAAAVKLTPAVFVLFFLVRRDRRAAVTAGVSFVVVNAIVALIAPAESRQYWRHTVFQTDRIGSAAYAGNQAVTGFLARSGVDGAPATIAWLLSVLTVLGLAAYGMRRAAGQPAWALSLNALAGLLISPISWSHHWVWVAPVLLCLVLLGRGRPVPLALAGIGAVLAAVAPHWRFTNGQGRERDWSLWQLILGSSYAWLALVLLVLSCRRGGPLGRDAAPGRSARRPRHRPSGQHVRVDVEDTLADPGAGVEDRPVIL